MEDQAMKCSECGAAEMRERVETVPYDGSGLEGVYLEGVRVWRCPRCDEWEIAIPRIESLHRAIATHLAERREKLGPREVRFLRKYLGLSSTDFAGRVGVDKATVSRWERVDAPMAMSPQMERLLRVLVLSEKPIESYPLEEMAAQEATPAEMRWSLGSRGWKRKGVA
jgi:putative zinc finger/helix-turn-helix YgiT family protein